MLLCIIHQGIPVDQWDVSYTKRAIGDYKTESRVADFLARKWKPSSWSVELHKSQIQSSPILLPPSLIAQTILRNVKLTSIYTKFYRSSCRLPASNYNMLTNLSGNGPGISVILPYSSRRAWWPFLPLSTPSPSSRPPNHIPWIPKNVTPTRIGTRPSAFLLLSLDRATSL